MNKAYSILTIFILASTLLFAQEAKVTEVVRKDRNIDDIELLNKKYDLDAVSMDEVYIINNGRMEKISSIKTTVGIQSSVQLPTISPIETADETDIVVVKKEVGGKKSNSSTSGIAVKSKISYAKKKSKSKVKMKRIKLKKRKRSPRSTKKGSCYRF